MIKALIAGIWAIALTLGAAYFGSTWKGSEAHDENKAPPVELVKLKPITVPVVSTGGVEGYLLAVLGYNVEKGKLANPSVPLESILQDESFRTLYGVDAIKYKKPRKSDLAEISKMLVDIMNKRLGADAIKEVLIEELSFVPKESARSGRGG